MDLFAMCIVGILIGILSAVAAAIMKKNKWQILLSGIVGLLIGTPIGYLLAPFIISFM